MNWSKEEFAKLGYIQGESGEWYKPDSDTPPEPVVPTPANVQAVPDVSLGHPGDVYDEMAVPVEYASKNGQRFKSKLERSACTVLVEKYAPVWMRYEPWSFRMNGGGYTPDFILLLPSGRLLFIEVKSHAWKKAHGSARGAIRAMREFGVYHWLGEMKLMVGKRGVFEYHDWPQ